MIKNKYLLNSYNREDIDYGINELLELLHVEDKGFLESIQEPEDLDNLEPNELKMLTIYSALIVHGLIKNHIKVPSWLDDERLSFRRPYVHLRRCSDFEYMKVQFFAPAVFKRKNVYFDLEGITRY